MKLSESIRKRVVASNSAPTSKFYAMDVGFWYKLADYVEKQENAGRTDEEILYLTSRYILGNKEGSS
jgi:hypothetical protein